MKKLTCTDGLLKGVSKEIKIPGLRLGTGNSCDICLPQSGAGAQEIRINFSGSLLSLSCDKDATISINGKPAGDGMILADGDIISLSGMTFDVEIDRDPDPPATIFKQTASEAFLSDMDIPDASMPPEAAELLKKKHAALGKFSKIPAGTSLNKLFEELLDTAAGAMPAQRGCVLLKNESSGELIPEAARNYDKEPADTVFQPSRALTENALRNQVLTITLDASQDERFNNSESVMIQNVQSAICVPLIISGHGAGVIYFESRNHESFSKHDAAFCAALATHASGLMKQMPRFAALKNSPKEEHPAQNIPAPKPEHRNDVKRSSTMMMVIVALLVFFLFFAIGLLLF